MIEQRAVAFLHRIHLLEQAGIDPHAALEEIGRLDLVAELVVDRLFVRELVQRDRLAGLAQVGNRRRKRDVEHASLVAGERHH